MRVKNNYNNPIALLVRWSSSGADDVRCVCRCPTQSEAANINMTEREKIE